MLRECNRTLGLASATEGSEVELICVPSSSASISFTGDRWAMLLGLMVQLSVPAGVGLGAGLLCRLWPRWCYGRAPVPVRLRQGRWGGCPADPGLGYCDAAEPLWCGGAHWVAVQGRPGFGDLAQVPQVCATGQPCRRACRGDGCVRRSAAAGSSWSCLPLSWDAGAGGVGRRRPGSAASGPRGDRGRRRRQGREQAERGVVACWVVPLAEFLADRGEDAVAESSGVVGGLHHGLDPGTRHPVQSSGWG